jgi:hypothetical protein
VFILLVFLFALLDPVFVQVENNGLAHSGHHDEDAPFAADKLPQHLAASDFHHLFILREHALEVANLPLSLYFLSFLGGFLGLGLI